MADEQAQQLGVKVDADGVSFGVWAPFADSVAVIGSFNEWNEEADKLVKSEDGCWYGSVGHAQVGQQYKYVIHNGEQKLYKNDPRALQLTASGDNSVIVGNDFDWSDDDFTLVPVNQRVVYELHIGTFHRTDPATPGSFEAATAKLDYLQELGINVIELLPVTSTTADRWWGYDPDYLFAVDAAYGGRRAFLEFVKAAHAQGIGVVLDVVYNHLSPYPGMDLWQFDGWNQDGKGGIYFYNDWRGDTPWGPRPDYGRAEVRQYITDNVRMWLRDCHVDGLRVDAVFAIRNAKGENNNPETDLPDGWKLLQELNGAAREEKAEAFMVGEDMALNESITKPAADGGAGFGAQWEASLPSTLRHALNPVNDSDRNISGVRDAIFKNYNNDAFQRVVYSESHDADANGNARTNEEISPGDATNLVARRRTALGAAVMLTMPGVPMLFQGQEFMESGWFNHWQALDWDKTKRFAGMVQLYRDLIALRQNRGNLAKGLTGQGCAELHYDEEHKLLAYHRWDQGGAGDDTVVVLNFSNQPLDNYRFKFPADGAWKVRFNSDWQGYGEDLDNTPTPDVEVHDGSGGVNVGPYSLVILSQDAETGVAQPEAGQPAHDGHARHFHRPRHATT